MTATKLAPTQGTLRLPDGRTLPLRSTDVRATLCGPIADVRVEQVFHNDTDVPIEAVYSFPLPPDASVHEMRFRIDDRVVEAVIKGREEARKTYEQARAQGRAATLLEEDTPTLFTLSVANVQPGAEIRVELGYQQTLGFDDGQWRFAFPMVAPETYVERAPDPAAPSPEALRGLPPPRLPTGERGADVRLSVDVLGHDVEALRCTSHLVEVEALDDDAGQRVRLAASDAIANRDFVLTFRAADRGVRPTLRFQRAAGETGTVHLVLTPPAAPEVDEAAASEDGLKALRCGNCGAPVGSIDALERIPGVGAVFPCEYCDALLVPSTDGRTTRPVRPRDVTLLVDRSASMRGAMPQVRRAVAALLAELEPGDAVQVIAFDHERIAFDGEGRRFVTLTPEVATRIDAFLSDLPPRGGTELLRAIDRASQLPIHDERTPAVVLITDAAVGNEGRLLREARERLGDQRRLFVLGVGPAVDERLAARLARTCGGASDLLSTREEVEPVLARFARRVRDGGPVLTGLSLTWTDDEGRPSEAVTDIFPASIPDLYGGEPVHVLGRFTGEGPVRLALTGATADGKPFRQHVELTLPAEADDAPGLARLWAQRRIDAWLEHLALEPGDATMVEEKVTALGIEHALVTRYTSLVAEDSEVVGDGEPVRVEQPTPAPGDDPLDGFEAEVETEAMPMMARSMSMDAMMADEEAPAGAPVAFGGAPPAPMMKPAMEMAAPPATLDAMVCEAPKRRSRKRRGLADAVGSALGSVGRRPVRGSGGRSRGGGGTRPPRASRPHPQIDLGAAAHYDAEELRWLRTRKAGELDLVFVVDATGSMGPYIEQVKARLLELVDALKSTPLCRSLRLGLIEYRDHPPQDSSFVTRVTALTERIQTVERAAKQMRASGGGDGPEAVSAALHEVVRLQWRPHAARAVVWFGDAPPHGVEPHGDGFPDGCPQGHHWFTEAESCREMGISVYGVGCLPGLRSFAGAEDVFKSVSQTTRATYLPLTDASMLVPLIAGSAVAELDRRRVLERVADAVQAHRTVLEDTDDVERVRWLTELLRRQGVRARAMQADDDADHPSLGFRDLAPEDVETALDRLRYESRAGL